MGLAVFGLILLRFACGFCTNGVNLIGYAVQNLN